ncbi:hypothetical protein [Pedobacter xixiisoli]|uniref:Uncharacterized protein n=1 Tax=Pedobacter xixiisoli TaxID=1476464 RepID=A0A286ADG7_9SPHI|nr:hypothetical protein [Pedobacter xixiisoli]SOD19887.1 hypothetical protein SAMN06297358_3594 [Pedobacter xixiisoli]
MSSKLTLFAVCCLLFSCSFDKKDELKIDFSSDRTVILFTGVDEVSLFRAKEQKDSLSQELVSVFETDENSGIEKQVQGKIETKGDTLIFVPQHPFVKGHRYEVNTILNSSFGKTEDLLKADMGKTVKRQEKVLLR